MVDRKGGRYVTKLKGYETRFEPNNVKNHTNTNKPHKHV